MDTMPPKEFEMYLQTRLEEAEHMGHEQEIADILTVLAAADFELYGSQQEHESMEAPIYFRERLDAAMIPAAQQNQAELVKLLLLGGADPSYRTRIDDDHSVDDYSGSVLHDAAKAGYTEVVQALLDAGADTDPWYKYSEMSPLKSAVAGGHIDMVRALLAAGAKVHGNLSPTEFDCLIDYEAAGDQVEMTQIMLEAGAYNGWNAYHSCNALMDAARHGKGESAALLIQASYDVSATIGVDVCRDSVLTLALEGEDDALDAIRLLLNAGAEINGKGDDGCTALICAAEYGSCGAVRLLLSAGANMFSRAQSREATFGDNAKKAGNAFDLATDDAVRELLKSEMHRLIAATLSVLPAFLPVEVRQNIMQLSLMD